MANKKPLCWVLAGPTASGKTALSIRLARAHACEIVCMDSMQIYRGMNIGTAKPTLEEMGSIPHHLLDVVQPGESFSVAQYQQLAERCIGEILARGHQPLLVGGTGFYLRALRHPMTMGMVTGDEKIRATLETIAEQTDGRTVLHGMLQEVDPATAARLPVNDVRRVVRALEVYQLTGIPFSKQPASEEEPPFQYRVATLTMDRSVLYKRIGLRVDQMMADGLLEEVRSLLSEGVSPQAQAMKAIGYKELVPVLEGRMELEEAVALLKQNTRHYAKRQLTWMRREEDVFWVDSLQPEAFALLDAYFAKGEEA